MIDSINITITDVKRLNVRYLRKVLEINDYKEFIDKSGKYGCSFSYKTVEFKYYIFNNLFVKSTTHKILDKRDITVSDRKEYNQKLMKIIREVLNGEEYTDTLLNQIDYCIDIYTGIEKVHEYITIMNKCMSSYKGKRRRKRYKTSIQLTTKTGQIIKGYDKESCIKDKAKDEKNKILHKYKELEIREKKLQELKEKVQKEIYLYKRYYQTRNCI